MIEPSPKPENETHTITRCDGTTATWTENWQWVPDVCELCGRPEEDGGGQWQSDHREVAKHVGPIEKAWDLMRPKDLRFTPGHDYDCPTRCLRCGEVFPPLEIGYRGTIVDIRDVDLRDTTS